MKRQVIAYSADELSWVEANKTLPIGDLHAAFVKQFERMDIEAKHLHWLRKRKGWRTGRTGCFAKGSEPPNKGKRMPFNAASAATRFKKGQLPHNTKFEGHESLSRDGYVLVSIRETNPHTGFERRYVQKHRYLWEQLNGPVPDGMSLKCLDSDKTNTDPSNWKAVPRGMLPRLNSRWGHRPRYDAAPQELKPVIMAVAELEHVVAEKQKGRV